MTMSRLCIWMHMAMCIYINIYIITNMSCFDHGFTLVAARDGRHFWIQYFWQQVPDFCGCRPSSDVCGNSPRVSLCSSHLLKLKGSRKMAQREPRATKYKRSACPWIRMDQNGWSGNNCPRGLVASEPILLWRIWHDLKRPPLSHLKPPQWGRHWQSLPPGSWAPRVFLAAHHPTSCVGFFCLKHEGNVSASNAASQMGVQSHGMLPGGLSASTRLKSTSLGPLSWAVRNTVCRCL